MGKLTLRLDELEVDSFDTTASRAGRGTVFGEQCTCYTACTCPGCPTCDESCNGTCDPSCNGSCNGSCDPSCDVSGCGTCFGDETCLGCIFTNKYYAC